ncbi:MAG: LVIVD repeat-containing protein [Candidatus Dormibacteria bacterium]
MVESKHRGLITPVAGAICGGLAVVAVLTGYPTPSVGLAAAGVSVPKATCGPGSRPEPGLQGQVPLANRASGDSQLGYRCNLELVGQFAGQGASWQMAWYGNCAYFDQARTVPGGTAGNEVPYQVDRMLPGRADANSPGTVVVDVSDPTQPRGSEYLKSNAMIDAWESLKVNQKRGLLAAVEDGGPGFDIYDVTTDCAHPKLDASVDLAIAGTKGHAGNFTDDGLTYYGTDLPNGFMYPIDITDPTKPTELSRWSVPSSGGGIHDVSLSPDGNLGFLAFVAGNGLLVVDTSQVQARKSNPQMSPVGHLFWTDGSEAQQTMPLSYGGKPFLLFTDEGGRGAARLLDISDISNIKTASRLWLEIDDPANNTTATADEVTDPPGLAGGFGYQGHYCNVDRTVDPTVMACSYFQSGLRVFDVRDPYHPREIAYYNPPARPGYMAGSNYSRSGLGAFADWTTAMPRILTRTGQVWFTSQENGFQVVRFTNGVFPYTAANPGSSSSTAAPSILATTGKPVDQGRGPMLLGLPTGAAGLLLLIRQRRRRVRQPADLRTTVV